MSYEDRFKSVREDGPRPGTEVGPRIDQTQKANTPADTTDWKELYHDLQVEHQKLLSELMEEEPHNCDIEFTDEALTDQHIGETDEHIGT